MKGLLIQVPASAAGTFTRVMLARTAAPIIWIGNGGIIEKNAPTAMPAANRVRVGCHRPESNNRSPNIR